MTNEQSATTLPPAGWYPDPELEGGKRYWDGKQWTDRRQPSRQQARVEKKARLEEELAQRTEAAKQKREATQREREAAKAGTTTLATADAGVAAEVGKLKQRVKDALAENLSPGEEIQVVIQGASGQAIVGTTTRAFVLKPGFLAGATFGAEVTSWSYRNLVGVQVHKGMVTGSVLIQSPGQSGQRTRYWGASKEDDPHKAPNAIPVAGNWPVVKKGVAKLQALIDAAHAPQPETIEASTQSVADELQKLAGLRDSGVLSEDEFAAAKKRLLDA